MGLARLNIWIHGIEDPCRISNKTWYVVVTDCQNRVVEWCGRKYADLPAKCGHREVSLPPGCYLVWAALNVFDIKGGIQGNYVTHFAFAKVDCHETACVHLYAPTYKKCWQAFRFATEFIAERGGFPRDTARNVEKFVGLGEQLTGALDDGPGDRQFATELERLPAVLKKKPKFEKGDE